MTWDDGTHKSTDNYFNVPGPKEAPPKKKRIYAKRIRKKPAVKFFRDSINTETGTQGDKTQSIMKGGI